MELTEYRSGWVFSKKVDLAVFISPIFIAMAASLLLYILSIDLALSVGETYALSFFLYVIIDHAHVYSTFFMSAGFKDEFERRKLVYLLVPLVILATLVGLNYKGELYFQRFFAYFSAYHFIKQQYGWMMITSKKAGHLFKKELLFDQLAIWGATLFPLIFQMAHREAPAWFINNDLHKLPDFIAPIAVGGFVLTILGYLAVQIYTYKKFKKNNWPKILIFVTSAFIWCWAFMVFANYDGLVGPMMVLHHGIPFLYIVYRYCKKKMTRLSEENNEGKSSFDIKKRIVFVYAIVLFLSSIHFFSENFYQYYFFVMGQVKYDIWVKYWLFPLLATPGVMHYIIDSYFWKSKYNPGVTKNL